MDSGMILAGAPVEGPSIQSMKERHFEMLRRLVAGDPAVDICKALGMTQAWFSIVQASPVFQAELMKMREEANRSATDISGRIKRLAPDAMTVLERAIRGKDGGKTIDGITEAKRADLAMESLALAGHGKPLAPTAGQVSVKVEIVQFSAADAPTVIEGKATVVKENNESEVDKTV